MNDEKFKSILGNNNGGDDGENGPTVGSIEEFTEWKQDFLDELRGFLDPNNTAVAREADEELYVRLEGLARSCLEVKTLCKEGKIGAGSTSVKGQRAINELCTTLKECESSVEGYVPKTKASEKKAGYTKFDLAAVAIRDGFRVYGLMCATRDYLVGLVDEGGPLAGVLRDNQLATCMYYFRCLEAFCECARDLGIYRVMEECVEVYKVRPRGKKKKKGQKKTPGGDDALDLSSDEERALEKIRKKKKQRAGGNGDSDDDDDGIINNGQMFSNRNLGSEKKTRAIMTKGWSNGLAPGEEVKGPDGGTGGGKKKKKKKKNNNKDKAKAKKGGGGKPGSGGGGKKGRRRGGGGGNASSDDDDYENYEDDDDDDEDMDSGATGGTGSGDDETPKDPAANPKSKKKKPSSSKGGGEDGKDGDGDDDNSTTQPTDDDEGSSSEEGDDESDDGSGSDEEEEEEYIYYFDPVQKVVGKIPRAACEKEGLIVKVDETTGAETFDGKVDHWDTKAVEGGEDRPGLADLIGSMRGVLRPPKQQ